MTTDLIPSINPKTLLEKRDRAFLVGKNALEVLVESQRLANEAGFPGVAEALRNHLNGYFGRQALERIDETLERYRQELDTRGWWTLLDASGLRAFMDAEARSAWKRALKANEAPPLDEGNIEATFRSIHGDRKMMVERGVIGVFRRLSWDYKTNQPGLIGKKIIVRHFLDHHGCMGTNPGGLDDLMRALCIYDNQPEPDHRTGIFFSRESGASAWSNEYVDVKWFKNGNAHITFKRQDLVDKLNAVVSRHYPGALPAPRKSK